VKIPVETKPALWGMAGGAAALAIIGFTWGGWSTRSTAEKAATMRVDDAVVAVLAPVCADRFGRTTDGAAELAALKKADVWTRGEFVEKRGWATFEGREATGRVTAVANACATLLVGG
jgi:hypothetical protein